MKIILPLLILGLTACGNQTLDRSAQCNGTVRLAWDSPNDARIVGYAIHYGNVSGGPYVQHIRVGDNLTATVNGLCKGNTYYFVATSYSESAESGPSNEVNTTTAPLRLLSREIGVLVK